MAAIGQDFGAVIPESAALEIIESKAEAIQRALDAADSFESFKAELEKLAQGWPPEKMAEAYAAAGFKARALGCSAGGAG